MKKIRSLIACFVILLLFISILPLHVSAAAEKNEQTKAIVLADEQGGKVDLLKEDRDNSSVLASIPDNTEVAVLESGEKNTYIEYINPDTHEQLLGYVDAKHLVDPSKVDQLIEQRNGETSTENVPNTKKNNHEQEDHEVTVPQEADEPAKNKETGVDQKASFDGLAAKKQVDGQSVKETPKTSSEKVKNELVPKPKMQVKAAVASVKSQVNATSDPLYGIALKSSTHVYTTTSTGSKVLKSYSQGSLLKYYSYTSDWNKCTVYINGKATTGYILKSDVENVVKSPSTLKGIALKSPTRIYSRASTGSSVLKSYSQGSVLKYQTFTSGWYSCTVYVNGKWVTGYINHSDVAEKVSSQQTLNGIALKSSTHVYSLASTGSKILKSYSQGTILKYKTFVAGWYECTVYINGKATIGYISSSDVANTVSKQVDLQGIALKSPTRVYSLASTGSKILKSYSQGTILKYKTLAKGWYEAKVYINGKATTGYINSNDVAELVTKQKELRGVALKSPTRIYSLASTGSALLKSYSQGSVLKYKTFASGWYECTVYINGKKKTGYIKSGDVQNGTSSPQTIEGVAQKDPTKIYSQATTSSKVLKSYAIGSILKYRTFVSGWYECTVYIKGVATTGYINASDVQKSNGKINIIQQTTKYNITLQNALNMQMDAGPRNDNWESYAYVSSDYIDKNSKVVADALNVREKPTTQNSRVVGTLKNGDKVTIVDSANGWDKIKFSWQQFASSEEVSHYLNPKNFSASSPDYYQFLQLSKPAGLDATEVNNNILKGEGVLEGKASAFISAAKQFGINEIYLMSHSMLETGHGTSALAKGISYNGKTVYNVYGIGANDGNATENGAKYAYEAGWTSVEKAIIGGAEFVAQNYIAKGQDTLYKMRWNPAGMVQYGYATHQYATDIGWAVKQTSLMVNMYSKLTQYTLVFDVPVFN
ncbi:SH3 domain-containing protein [Camelliibacillus cellulosilyticus]|uniref:SH3 domain-containing protein n=1 Tax=Camelliibacillus cellulosilyticus TaxID=2174486 RepID=A0ABV9GR18_9BACL